MKKSELKNKIKDIILELTSDSDKNLIIESSLNRIFQHFGNREMVFISANRSTEDPVSKRRIPNKDNKENTKRLKADLNALNLGYVPIDGVGQEVDVNKQVFPVVEDSFVVPNGVRTSGTEISKSVDDFKDKLLDIAAKYNQDVILYTDGTGGGELIDVQTKNVVETFSDIKPGIAMFFSRLRNGKRKGVSGRGEFKITEIKLYKVKNFMEGMAHNENGLFISL